MKRIVPMIAILTSAVFCLSVSAWAQCNPTCQGDFNLDGQVTVDEIITAVNNAHASALVRVEARAGAAVADAHFAAELWRAAAWAEPMNRLFPSVMPAVFKRASRWIQVGARSGFPLEDCGNDEKTDQSDWFIEPIEPFIGPRGEGTDRL